MSAAGTPRSRPARARPPEPALGRLLAEIRACRICRDRPLGAPLAHQPRPVLQASEAARIVVVGQAPGLRVHESGRPFDDRSGDRLRDWLGVDRETFYDPVRLAIIPMGFCFPGYDAKGSDRPPRRECRAVWHDDLFATLPAPELLVLVGGYAQDYHLARLGLAHLAGRNLTETVANWRAIYEARSGPRVFVLPHPSWRNTGWIKKNPWFTLELLPALRDEATRTLVGAGQRIKIR